ncbi:MAG: hypothetical protein ACOCYD_01990 [bacterium]
MIQILKQTQSKVHLFLLTMFLTVVAFVGNAQSPTHIPREETSPVDFFESTENIVFFIVIPVAIIILYILWRRSLKKQREDKESNQ